MHRHRHGSTAWVFDLAGARLTLALSPGPFRSFSGEGALLDLLVHPDAEEAGRRILDSLGWSPVIDPVALSVESGLSQSVVRAGLGWLAASGRLGFDLDEGAWFHRELPVDSDAVMRRHPRLNGARRLVETGGVVAGEAPGSWRVRGTKGEVHAVSERATCTCRWGVEHDGSRGPCKHVLAVMLLLRS